MRFLVLLLALLLGPSPARAARDHQLVVVDSPGQPADELAQRVWSMTRHPRSRCEFRWIRIGSPASQVPEAPESPEADRPPIPETSPVPEAAATGTPAASPSQGPPEPPPIEPEWDPEGRLSAPWRLEGLPRILLVGPGDRVLQREVFLPEGSLRYLSRNPGGFSPSPPETRMGRTPPEPEAAPRAGP